MPHMDTNCWIWTAWKNQGGYGQFRLGEDKLMSHRVSWFITFGEIGSGLIICHHCDNPSCVRPEHLFMGTDTDNQHDMFAKGRAVRHSGERHYNARLTKRGADIIRWMAAGNRIKYSDIGRLFDIDDGQVAKIASGKTWK